MSMAEAERSFMITDLRKHWWSCQVNIFNVYKIPNYVHSTIIQQHIYDPSLATTSCKMISCKKCTSSYSLLYPEIHFISNLYQISKSSSDSKRDWLEYNFEWNIAENLTVFPWRTRSGKTDWQKNRRTKEHKYKKN